MDKLQHLVVAHLQQQAEEAGFRSTNLRGVLMMVRRLFTRLPLSRRFDVRIERLRGATELMCAFEEERDADEAAQTVGATRAVPYAGWQTQRNFVLDAQKQDELSVLAGKYRHPNRRL